MTFFMRHGGKHYVVSKGLLGVPVIALMKVIWGLSR